MEKVIKFNELKVGDIFTICREENKIAYMKDEYKIIQLSNGKSFKSLNGCTRVKRIGESL